MQENSYANAILKKFQENFPSRCAYCNKAYTENSALYGLCTHCTSQIKRIQSGYCKRCGNIFSLAEQEKFTSSCQRCEQDISFQFDDLRFYTVYEEITQDLIQGAKFYNNLIYLRTLADLVTPLVLEFQNFDFILPMPLHKKRIVKRGYNQCLEMTKFIKKKTKIPYSTDALIKIRHTKAQSSLSRLERFFNISAAFEANKSIVNNKTILLFDDVCTTGSTIKEARRTLYEAGAHKVFVLYIAGTAPEKTLIMQ